MPGSCYRGAGFCMFKLLCRTIIIIIIKYEKKESKKKLLLVVDGLDGLKFGSV